MYIRHSITSINKNMIKKMLVILLVLLVQRFSAVSQWASLYETAGFLLDGTVKVDTLLIPIKLKEGELDKVTLVDSKPVYVRLDNKFKKAYADAITISRYSSGMFGLQLIVDMEKLTEPGTYQVLFFLASPGRPNQDVIISLIHPAAVLDTVSTMKITINGSSPGSYDPFVLKEKGNRTNIRELTIHSPLFPGIPDSNLLQFKTSHASIHAGTVFTTNYQLNDALIEKIPLGVTKGKVELNAPEMEKPVTIEVEIINKRSKWWIIITVLAGILLGTMVRIFLKNRKELATIKLRAQGLAERIAKDTASIQDVSFKNEIRTILQTLNDDLNKSGFTLKADDRKKELEDSITQATNDYNAKKQAFEARLKKTSDDLRLLLPAFRNNFYVPFIRGDLAQLQTPVDLADRELLIFNVSGAENAIKETVIKVNKALQKYKTYAGPLITQLNNDELIVKDIAPEIIAQIKTNAQGLNAKLTGLKTDGPTAAEAISSIENLDQVQSNLESTLRYLVNTVTSLYNIRYKADGDAQIMGELKLAFGNWKSSMDAIILNPYTIIDKNLVQALNAAFEKVLAAGNQRAVRSTDKQLPDSSIGNQGGVGWIEKTFTGYASLSTGFLSGLWSDIGNTSSTIGKILLIEAIRVIILAFVLCLILYKTNAPGFFGTDNELIDLFLLGFSLDITLDSILQLGAKK